MSKSDVPDVIATYQRAHDRRDTEVALAAFGPDATVIDDGAAYVGAERIRWWLTNAASEFTYTRTLTAAEDLGDGAYLVHNHLSGQLPRWRGRPAVPVPAPRRPDPPRRDRSLSTPSRGAR